MLKWIVFLSIELVVRFGIMFLLLVVLNDDNFQFYTEWSLVSLLISVYGLFSPTVAYVHRLYKRDAWSNAIETYLMDAGVPLAKLMFFSFLPVAIIGGVYDFTDTRVGYTFVSEQLMEPIFVSLMGLMAGMGAVAIPAALVTAPQGKRPKK